MSTRNIVPRSASEGTLGTPTKQWRGVYADALNGADITNGVATLNSAGTVDQLPVAAQTTAEADKIPLGGTDGPLAAGWMAPEAFPGHYSRDTVWTADSGDDADRYALISPSRMAVDVEGTLLTLSTKTTLDLSSSDVWDSTTTNYTMAANRAGMDFYIYACVSSGALVLLLSANAGAPTGYTTSTSRLIGGFHCLCADVGTVSGHALTGYVAGDIIPGSVWDLKHRPKCEPEGMVFIEGMNLWVDIYLASYSGGELVSVYGGTIADGTSATTFCWYDFVHYLGVVGKRLPTWQEFQVLAYNSNKATIISTAADPVTTGGHSDTAGLRMVSDYGVEDCCGASWQWLGQTGAMYATTEWTNQDTGYNRGYGSAVPTVGLGGGDWDSATYAGWRCSYWQQSATTFSNNAAGRGVCASIEEV